MLTWLTQVLILFSLPFTYQPLYAEYYLPLSIPYRLGVSCPKNHNPADFFIQLLAIVPSQEICSYETIDTVCEAYESSNYKGEIIEHQRQLSIANKVSVHTYNVHTIDWTSSQCIMSKSRIYTYVFKNLKYACKLALKTSKYARKRWKTCKIKFKFYIWF